MDYIIAGFRVRMEQEKRLFPNAEGMFERSFAVFGAPVDGNAPVAMHVRADERITEQWTGGELEELTVFPFDDAGVDCRFLRSRNGYLLSMEPRDDGRTVHFFKAFDGGEVFSDLLVSRVPTQDSLLRFGLWFMFGLCVVDEALAIHSSVIEHGGRAVLFLGESGTGKSTHTRLWREHIEGARLVNDDSPVVRMYDGVATVFGSPWSGKTHCYRAVARPIAGIVRLSQGPRNEISRLRPLQAIGALLPSTSPAFAYDNTLQDRVCGVLSAILSQVPVWHLSCLPDREAAELSFQTVFGRG